MQLKIDIKKTQVYFSPENEEEKAKLTALWKILIDCVKDTRKLVPVGEYVPQKNDTSAAFYIEGLELEGSTFAEVRVDKDTEVYCKTCNKLVKLKAGEVIPLCCGTMMLIVD
jgi:hypothetical protein